MDNQKATHLIIDRKKVSILAAGFITLIATSFMIGYFKGYKNNLENKKIEVLKESLNDQAIFNLTLATHDKIQEVNLEPVLLADLEEAQNLEIRTLPNIKLPEDLTEPVCVFYIVLRGLDSIEDDMDFAQELKLLLLRSFYEKCEIDQWNIEGVGDSHDYRILLKHFEKVIGLYKSLNPSYQRVISDITKRMGNGMADFAEKKVYSLDDYNLYCHYVAGLVGIGLSGLFSASSLESPMLETEERLANSMGLLLQKTNIIRDYHEDLHSGRIFWPGEVWDKYGKEIGDFEKAPESLASTSCLNHLILDAMQHVEDSLHYMSLLHNKQIFRFCAIPQVMAIATLAKIFNNTKVFTSNVKIRKGLGAKLMYYTNDMSNLLSYVIN